MPPGQQKLALFVDDKTAKILENPEKTNRQLVTGTLQDTRPHTKVV